MTEVEDLPSAKAAIDALRIEKEKCEAEVASVRAKLHGAVRKGKSIEAERTKLAKQLEQLKEQLESKVQGDAAQKDNEKLRAAIEDNKRLREDLDVLKASQKQQQAKLAELESLREAHRAAEAEIEKLKAQQKVGVAEALDALKKEHQAALESTVARHQEELESQRTEMYKLVTQADAELASVNEMNRELQIELEQLQDVQAAENLDLGTLQERIGALEAELAEAFSAKQDAALQNANMASKLDAVWKRCEELEQQADSKAENANGSARLEFDGTASDESTAEPAANTQLAILEAALQEAKERAARMEQEVQSLRVTSSGNSEELQRLNRQIENQSKELDLARQNADVMREALQSAAVKIKEAQDSQAAAAAQAEARGEEAAVLRKRVAELEGLLSIQQDLEVELAAAREAVVAAKEQGEDAHMQLRAKEVELAATASRAKELEEQLQQANDRADQLVSQAEAAAEAAKGEVGDMRAEAESQFAAARELREAAEEQQKAAAAAQEAAAEAVSKARQQAAAAEERAAAMQAEEAARKQRFGLLHSTFAKEKAALQDQVDALAAESADLKQSLQQRSQAAEEAEEKAAAAEQEANDLRQACQEARQAVEDLEGKLQALSASQVSAAALQAAISRAEAAEQQAEEVMSQRQALHAELASTKEQLASMKQQLAGSERRCSDVTTALNSLREAKAEQLPSNGHPPANGNRQEHRAPAGEDAAAEIAELQEEVFALQRDKTALLARVQGADKRVAAATAVQHAKIASLEKSNQELQWQIAMLARDPEAPPVRPRPQQAQPQNSTREPVSGEVTLPKLVGLVLRHRRGLLIGYAAVLHVLLYVLLQARGHASTACGIPAGSLDAFGEDAATRLRGFR